MPTAKKNASIEALKERLKTADSLFFADYRGLTVGELRTLRNALRKESASFSIVKNSLFGKAIGELRLAQLEDVLAGPTGVAFAGSDPVGPAKALTQFVADSKKLQLKGALIDGTLYDRKQIEALSKVPPRQELLAKLVGTLKAPMYGLVGVLTGNQRKLVYVLHAIQAQRS